MVKKTVFSLIIPAILMIVMSFCMADAMLADGTYTPDSFSWSGGSGRLKGIECEAIDIRDGEAYAQIVILSDKYSYISVNEVRYTCEHTDSESSAEIPVRLNADNTVFACTTAMSTPHEVEYHLRIDLNAANTDSPDTITLSDTVFTLDPETGTELFHIYKHESGSLITVEGIDDYYVAGNIESYPETISSEAIMISQPEHIFIASEPMMQYACEAEAENFTMVSGDLNLDVSGSVSVVSHDGVIDYKELLTGNCDLAVIAYKDRDSDTEEYLKMLGIPVFYDRSADEPDAEHAAAWNNVYAILLGIEGDDR